MAAITATTQDITGDFDLVVRGNPTDERKQAILQKALGAGGTNFVTCKVFGGQGCHFVKNTGTNAYKLVENVAGMTVEFNQ
jgi:hypothetical protein